MRHASLMLRCFLFFIAFSVVLGCDGLRQQASGDAKALATARRMVKDIGGRGALDAIRFLRFDFVVLSGKRETLRRTHTWDRQTGDYRLEGKMAGEPYVVLFNVNTRQGQAYRGLRLEAATDQEQLLRQAYSFYVNDTFWLLGLTRLDQPGVTLQEVGVKPVTGRGFPTIYARIDPAKNIAPSEQYWYHVDNELGLPAAFSFTPPGKTAPLSTFLWVRWQKLGKINLPARFEMVGGTTVIAIDRLYEPERIEATVFKSLADPTVEKIKPERQKR